MDESTLNEKELAVYNKIREYLQDNRYFKMEEIIAFLKYNLKKSLNLNTPGIKKILQSLIRMHLICPGSKYTSADLLENENRKLIFEYINSNPGIHFNELKDAHELGTRQTIWHTEMLQKFQLIRWIKIDNKKIYFPYELDNEYDECYYYLRNEKVQKIFDFLGEKSEPIGPTQLSQELNMHYNTISKYLKALTLLNLVTLSNQGKKKLYSVNSQKYSEIVKICDEKITL